MASSSLLLLAAYSVAIVAASLFGGWLPGVVRLTHTRIQLAMSLAAGLLLGIALYHLLPHGLARIAGPGAVETAVGWMLLGMMLMLLLLRLSPFHRHDFSGAGGGPNGADQGGVAPGALSAAGRAHYSGPRSLSWFGIALGLSLHTLTEGVALGVRTAEAGPAGFGVFLAILLHKPLDALSIAGAMRAAGFAHRARVLPNLGFALLCPVAAFATFWGVELSSYWDERGVGPALAFAAGAFLCISLNDLLPEVYFHRHDRVKLAAAFLAGVGVAYALRYLEPAALHGGS